MREAKAVIAKRPRRRKTAAVRIASRERVKGCRGAGCDGLGPAFIARFKDTGFSAEKKRVFERLERSAVIPMPETSDGSC